MGSIGIMRVGPPENVVAPVTNATAWGWFLFLSSLFWPRLFIIGFWIFDSGLLARAYSSWIIPAVGFVILPWTTIAFAVMWGLSSDQVNGTEWIVVAIGAALDVGTLSLGRHLTRRSR